MSQFAIPIAILALLGGAIVYGGNTESVRTVENQTASYVDPSGRKMGEETRWLLTDTKTQTSCILNKVRRITPSTSSVKTNPACSTILLDRLAIETWQKDNSGHVYLLDQSGAEIAEFTTVDDGSLVSTTGEVGRYALTPQP